MTEQEFVDIMFPLRDPRPIVIIEITEPLTESSIGDPNVRTVLKYVGNGRAVADFGRKEK